MTENNLKLTKTHLIIMAVILAIVLFFVFLNKPATEQTQNLQELSSETMQSQNNFNYKEQLVNQLMGEEKQLSENEISSRFIVIDFFDKLVEEGYLENSDFDKQRGKMTLYLDSSILFDKRVETWFTGFAFQIAGELENQNNFALAIDTTDTGNVIEFAVVAKVIPNTESIASLPENIDGVPIIETQEAVETLVGNEGRAKILDLIINDKVFAHFETGKVFAELKRLGLMGVMTRDGNMILEPKLK